MSDPNPLTRDGLVAELARLRALVEKLGDALARVRNAIRAKGYSAKQVEERDWNPDAHVEVTLTIADCRAVFRAADSPPAAAPEPRPQASTQEGGAASLPAGPASPDPAAPEEPPPAVAPAPEPVCGTCGGSGYICRSGMHGNVGSDLACAVPCPACAGRPK